MTEGKQLLFVGLMTLLGGMNIGYCIMIPSRNATRESLKECVSAAQEIKSNYDIAEAANKDTISIDKDIIELQEATIGLCKKTLDECEQTLGLLEGRTK